MSDVEPDASLPSEPENVGPPLDLDVPPPIDYAEIVDWCGRGGYIRNVMVETIVAGNVAVGHISYVLTSWRKGYCVLHLIHSARPRVFRDLDRLVALFRNDFGYRGPMELRMADDSRRPKLGLLRAP